MYVYNATVVGVHDGDTFTADWDLGARVWLHNQHLRIAGISARELSQPGGPEARDHLAGILRGGSQVVIRSVKADHDPADVKSFDRYVVTVMLPDGRDLATLLVNTGFACWWDGRRKPAPYPPWPIPTP